MFRLFCLLLVCFLFTFHVLWFLMNGFFLVRFGFSGLFLACFGFDAGACILLSFPSLSPLHTSPFTLPFLSSLSVNDDMCSRGGSIAVRMRNVGRVSENGWCLTLVYIYFFIYFYFLLFFWVYFRFLVDF